MKRFFTMKKIGIIMLVVIIIIGGLKFYREKKRGDLMRKVQDFNQLIKEKRNNYLDISELIVPLSYLQLEIGKGNISEAEKILKNGKNQLLSIGEEKSLKGILPEPKNNCIDTRYVNTKSFEAEPFINQDGNILYFQYHPYVNSKCAGVEREGFTCKDFEEKGLGPRTYRTELKNGRWTTPKLQEIKNCTDRENTCVILGASEDDKTAFVLVYKGEFEKADAVSCPEGLCGKSGDLFVSKKISDDLWDIPKPFNPDINTFGNDEDFRLNIKTLDGGAFTSSEQKNKKFPLAQDIYYMKFNGEIIDIDDYLETEINTPAMEILPSFDKEGNFYFSRGLFPSVSGFLTTSLMYYKGAPDNKPQCIKSNGKCLSNIISPSLGANKLVFRSPVPEGHLNSADSDIFYMEKIPARQPNEWGDVKPWDNCEE